MDIPEMTTSPSKIKEPFSDSKKEWNIKEHAVYCKYCKYTIMTKLAGPRCGNCKAYLITPNPPRDLTK